MAASKQGDWYAPLRDVESRGSQVNPVGGLAGLAAAREKHLGQFFTPDKIVEFMWRIAGLLDDTGRGRHRNLTVLDNSFGSGRMFQYANPDLHTLFGIEVDRPLAERVQAVVEQAGFVRQLEIGSLDEFRGPDRETFDYGLINPPFSIALDSPFVQDFDAEYEGGCGVNAYGKYGPHSSTVSHRYALAQALEWCDRVIAVVPRSLADAAPEIKPWECRRVATFHLPRATFRAEGAEVDTSILVYGPETEREEPAIEATLTSLDHYPLFSTRDVGYKSADRLKLRRVTDTSAEPATTLPVTDDRRVWLSHQGRKLILKFACAIAQARVLNRILLEPFKQPLDKNAHRRPDCVQYTGQGWLDLQNYLAQSDPLATFDLLIDTIESIEQPGTDEPYGFEVVAESAARVRSYLSKRARRADVHREPFRQTVYLHDGGLSRWLTEQGEARVAVRAKTKEPRCIPEAVVIPENMGRQDQPRRRSTYGYGYHYETRVDYWIRAGEIVMLRRLNKRSDDNEILWSMSHRYGDDSDEGADGTTYQCAVLEEDLTRMFDFPDFTPATDAWAIVHAGLGARFPQRYEAQRKRALALGLDKVCSWSYQFDDLVEISMKRGAIVAWEMGLGKARLAIALCLLGGGKHNLITVEAHLLDEMKRELTKLGLPKSSWQIVTKPEHVSREGLRQINVISYSKLKSVPDRKHPRTTYAKILRRRIHTHVCDEGHLLRNPKTQQTRAVIDVSAKGRRYLLSGTPIANYPRDILPLLQWVGGDGTAEQCFGSRWPYLTPTNLQRVDKAERGVDRFRNMFVVTTWITDEFADDLRSGAKREIPAIGDPAAFRRVVAPWVKRRVMEEPDVARHIRIPKPEIVRTELEWDDDHLAFYERTADEFVKWFLSQPEWEDKKGAAMIAVLAKIQALASATNYPQGGVDGQPTFRQTPTSQQRYAVDKLVQWTEEGHKSIFFCESPDVVRYLVSLLAERGVDAVPFHGGITIAQRIKDLDKKFREGSTPVLAATKGVLQTGYNIHQADRALFFDGTWTPKTEQQAAARLLRPQQQRQVVIEYLCLPGSIIEYQWQMVAAKAGAMRSGLDYGAEQPRENFQHLNTILKRFVDEYKAKHPERFSADALLISSVKDALRRSVNEPGSGAKWTIELLRVLAEREPLDKSTATELLALVEPDPADHRSTHASHGSYPMSAMHALSALKCGETSYSYGVNTIAWTVDTRELARGVLGLHDKNKPLPLIRLTREEQTCSRCLGWGLLLRYELTNEEADDIAAPYHDDWHRYDCPACEGNGSVEVLVRPATDISEKEQAT